MATQSELTDGTYNVYTVSWPLKKEHGLLKILTL